MFGPLHFTVLGTISSICICTFTTHTQPPRIWLGLLWIYKSVWSKLTSLQQWFFQNPWTRHPLVYFSSVQVSHSVVSDSLSPHGLQHTRPPCPSPTPRAYSNSHPSNQWCHPAISSSVGPFPSAFNLSQHQGLFKWVKFFPSGGQSIAVSASASVLPMNTQDWSPLGWTGWISLQAKGFSRVFSSTTVQKHQFFSTQLSL